MRIPDNRALKLVVLYSERPEHIIETRPARKGPTFREYQNTLISALSDVGAFAKFKEDVKTVPASEGVVVRAIQLGEQDR